MSFRTGAEGSIWSPGICLFLPLATWSRVATGTGRYASVAKLVYAPRLERGWAG